MKRKILRLVLPALLAVAAWSMLLDSKAAAVYPGYYHRPPHARYHCAPRYRARYAYPPPVYRAYPRPVPYVGFSIYGPRGGFYYRGY